MYYSSLATTFCSLATNMLFLVKDLLEEQVQLDFQTFFAFKCSVTYFLVIGKGSNSYTRCLENMTGTKRPLTQACREAFTIFAMCDVVLS